jgi:hypothetical protein
MQVIFVTTILLLHRGIPSPAVAGRGRCDCPPLPPRVLETDRMQTLRAKALARIALLFVAAAGTHEEDLPAAAELLPLPPKPEPPAADAA